MNSPLTLGALYTSLVQRLRESLGPREQEAPAMARLLLEHWAGLDRFSPPLHGHLPLPDADQGLFLNWIDRVAQGQPVQQVLGHAWFYGRRFLVNEHVLIPRPETEELVQHALQFLKGLDSQPVPPRVVDLGTGSGCIPLTIKLEQPQARVYALDISMDALAVAVENARLLNTTVSWLHGDMAAETLPEPIELAAPFDLIISNPPYVTRAEAAQMEAHVLEHEPHLALFAPDADALWFYRAIARHARRLLSPHGMVALEINEALGAETAALFTSMGWQAAVHKDLSGRDRFVLARP